ncbi:transporter [Ganoderma sinense ZZ0214-1]|uniref:Transporter n=1 Tax=Ganoderma sinense ZZ0214-1 TaxID=1077348 RepID=A0A2G8RY40_9APHY|nr:transporter [Ganoderma sinense ZZ0214-1]
MAHLSTFEGFVCGGLAGCTAVTFSNPAEVAKTRLQLQGELMKSGSGEKVYKNVFDVFVKTWRNEGFRGVQRGLGPAYFYQVALNGSRLGLYEPFRRWANKQLRYSPTQQLPLTSMGAGAVSAIVGSYVGNPLFLVKTRMQAYSPALPVGAQRCYRHGWDALSTIVREEGAKGLLRGWDAAILRGGIGGSVQLPSYIWSKTQLVRYGFDPDGMWTFLASSSIAGVILCLVMQPADTTLTRMYNQPTMKGPDGRMVGTLYKNPIDCLWKTFKAEGIRGWYKGTTAHFLRIAPHTIITLTANDIIVRFYLKTRHLSD